MEISNYGYLDDTPEQDNLKGFTKTFIRKGKEKREEDPKIKELLVFFRNNKLQLGSKITKKNFKNGLVEKVFVSTNCSELQLDLVKHYGKLNKVEIVQLDLDNSELAAKLSKPFLVSMVCVVEGKK